MIGLRDLLAMGTGLALGLFAWSLMLAYKRAGPVEAAVYVIAAIVLIAPVSKVQYIIIEQPLIVGICAWGAYRATRELAAKVGWSI